MKPLVLKDGEQPLIDIAVNSMNGIIATNPDLAMKMLELLPDEI